MAVQVLKAKGVPEDRILFVNLIASPSGVATFAKKFPKLRVVSAFIDQGLDEKRSVSHLHPSSLITGLLTPNTVILYPGWGILVTDTIHCREKHRRATAKPTRSYATKASAIMSEYSRKSGDSPVYIYTRIFACCNG